MNKEEEKKFINFNVKEAFICDVQIRNCSFHLHVVVFEHKFTMFREMKTCNCANNFRFSVTLFGRTGQASQ